MRMNVGLFEIYSTNPVANDATVRHLLKIPENRYYTVSMWPESVAGSVYVNREREVKRVKISKSNQPQ